MLDNEILLEPGLKDIELKNKEIIAKMKTILNEPTLTMKNFTQRVYYPLVVEKELGLNNSVGITKEELETIEKIANQIDPFFYALEYRKLIGGNLLKQISLKFENSRPHWETPNLFPYSTYQKVSFYSLDHPSFSGLLSALGSPLPRIPHFGESLQIVFSDSDEGYEVSFFLGQSEFSVCKNSNVCSYNDFKK